MLTRQMTLHTSLTATSTESMPWARRPSLDEQLALSYGRALPRAEQPRTPNSMPPAR